ncbi:response regulator [Glaciihabitans arcticus]|uniref:Response regulator n=1 Tax=Glaciihabitans arcticus TaxID=2668039 RepID=A0A4Q9GYC6_9MICO|nr:response regulator [Glaciihabitans arcticus]TBN57300.1 response regulator [Glaciihabitans arcticus]
MGDQVMDSVRVLVVEDSADQRLLLRLYFERAGCEVETATSGESAMEALTRLEPDLVVVDLVLPGMDGWSLTERIRAERPQVAIAITSVLDTADYPEADATLPKPVTGDDVRRVLRETVPRWTRA